MSQAIKSIPAGPGLTWRQLPFAGYLPAILPLIGAALVVTARITSGPGAVPNDGTLIILAQLCYITAAASLVTNFWAPVGFLQKLGLWTSSLGLFFNLSSWLVRWVTAGDREDWVRMTNQITGEVHFWWFFSYIPYTNLYDLSVAFAFGAAFTTLLISSRENTRFVGAISMPLISLILLMATFIGNNFVNLPPVLDSYWRPIHVGVASMSYGVALVSFALAVVYLIKDGVKVEAMGVAITAFFLVGFVVVWLNGGIMGFDPFSISYRFNPVIIGPQGMTPIGARVPLPGVGPLFAMTLLGLIGMAVCFLLYLFQGNEKAKRIGHWLTRGALTTQGATLAVTFYDIKTMGSVGSRIGNDQFYNIGRQMAGDEASRQSAENLVAMGANLMAQFRNELVLNLRSNPIEIASLFAIFAGILFILLFSFRTERLRANLPALEKIDSIIYKTVGVAFAGLAILLVTGAVWANESWGRYWGWDAKETGALVAWLAYAGYLHTRIAHGWTGRRSAYFALVGFLLVIFTYLGVSYILPGLHSYAKL